MRPSGTHHAAVVTAWLSIVDVEIAHAFICEQTPDGLLKLAPLYDLRANHHGRRVVGANRQEAIFEHGRDFAHSRIRRLCSKANENWSG